MDTAFNYSTTHNLFPLTMTRRSDLQICLLVIHYRSQSSYDKNNNHTGWWATLADGRKYTVDDTFVGHIDHFRSKLVDDDSKDRSKSSYDKNNNHTGWWATLADGRNI